MNRQVEVLVAYLQHSIHAQSKYSIHSPFVYHFYQNILQNGQRFPQYRILQKVRRELVTKSRYIKRKDLGSRAKESICDQRFVRVKDIARRSSVTAKKGELLFRLAREYKPAKVLELGTSLGISTMYFSLAVPEGRILTIEACLDSANVARGQFDHYGLKNITLIPGTFEDKLAPALEQLHPVDMVFFDGNHKKAATLRYFDQCLQHIHPGSVFIFDDIHWSSGMGQAWNIIRKNPLIKVTIDIYHMGIVFFKEELSKEDFRLRF
ncbi:MAG: class I SAM-dependent methyltransferase [Bacteroidales bacterium]|jgi:predicted O-methyltransferase YrrM|nr:class I SAM-dependent methyltransferase [Bacteroidales bacterium]